MRACAVRRYSRKTGQTYVWWARRFVMAHGSRHPALMGPVEISRFLTDLATIKQVAASTQGQALNALLFLYGQVLNQPIPPMSIASVRAKRPVRLPTVLSREQIREFFNLNTAVGISQIGINRYHAARFPRFCFSPIW